MLSAVHLCLFRSFNKLYFANPDCKKIVAQNLHKIQKCPDSGLAFDSIMTRHVFTGAFTAFMLYYIVNRRNNENRRETNMEKDEHIEVNFAEMLTLLKKKMKERDEEIKRLQTENTKLREKLTELDPNLVLEETFKRR